MTTDEIISSIKKSSIPTICVEGVQDRAALRLIESMIGISGAVLPCNGRSNLFEVWNRRSEFSDKKVVFLADRDFYVFNKIPSEYNGIIFTNGYSLENDILLTKRWMSIMTQEDFLVFDEAMKVSINYYWYECKKALEEGHPPVWVSTFRLYDENVKGVYVVKTGYNSCKLFKKIANKPFKFLRGKNLLDCVHVSLSHKKRTTKYSSAQIIEISLRPDAGRYLKLILAQINKGLC